MGMAGSRSHWTGGGCKRWRMSSSRHQRTPQASYGLHQPPGLVESVAGATASPFWPPGAVECINFPSVSIETFQTGCWTQASQQWHRPMWGLRRQAPISPALLSQLRQNTLWQGVLASPAQAAATAPGLASSGTACPPPPLPPGGGTAWPQQPTIGWRSFAALNSTAGGGPQPASPTAAATAAKGDIPWHKPGWRPRDGSFQPHRAEQGELRVIAAAASGTPPARNLRDSFRQSARTEQQQVLTPNPCPVCSHPPPAAGGAEQWGQLEALLRQRSCIQLYNAALAAAPVGRLKQLLALLLDGAVDGSSGRGRGGVTPNLQTARVVLERLPGSGARWEVDAAMGRLLGAGLRPSYQIFLPWATVHSKLGSVGGVRHVMAQVERWGAELTPHYYTQLIKVRLGGVVAVGERCGHGCQLATAVPPAATIFWGRPAQWQD